MSVAPAQRTSTSYHVFTPRKSVRPVTLRGLVIRLLLGISAFFILLVIAALLVAMSPTLSRSITALFMQDQRDALTWNGTDPVRMVIAGLDDRPGQNQSPHTDTMMVLSIDPRTDSVHMLSIPRDLWVNIPGYGFDRVNDAYRLGGTKLLLKTAEGITNTPIPYYAIVKFTGFQKVIDTLGGVTIDVKHAINDPTYPAPVGYGFAPLHIRAGVQHMDGKLALEYVRTRHDDPLGDLGRNQRQQQLLSAIKSQVITPGNIFKLPLILGSVRQAISTNFPYTNLTFLARVVMTTPKSHVVRRALNYSNNAVSNYVTPGGADVLLPNWPVIHSVSHSTFSDPSLRSASVEILNGSGIAGQAGALGQWMRSAGFDVAHVGNATRSNYEHTLVIRNTSASGNTYLARMAAELLQTHVVSRNTPGVSAPVVVIIGRDWTNAAQS